MKRKQAMILAMTVLTSLTAPALVSSGAATVQADTGCVSAAEADGSASGENAPVNGESDTCGAAKDFSEVDRLVEEAEREGNAAVQGTEIAEELYGASGSGTNTDDMVPMYRLYHPHSYEHFYTAAKNERETLISRGWIDEGIGWYAPKEGKPVYRLVNLFTADHHYTTSEHERDTLETMGWRYEGSAGRLRMRQQAFRSIVSVIRDLGQEPTTTRPMSTSGMCSAASAGSMSRWASTRRQRERVLLISKRRPGRKS